MRTAAESNEAYEEWLNAHTSVIIDDLDHKHKKMSKDETGFTYLRGTFYRWAETYPVRCPKLQDAPTVLAWGDAHVQNFGTWRDEQGRLIWGINDFDDACPAPYTNDLVRLATSALLAAADVKREEVSQWVLEGYTEGLEQGGQPFVLQEEHEVLRRLALARLEDPDSFWKEEQGADRDAKDDLGDSVKAKARQVKTKASEIDQSKIPFVVRTQLLSRLPSGVTDVHVYARKAGIGSLGRPRYSVIAEWRGGFVAREIKQLVPSAWTWARASQTPPEAAFPSEGQGQPNFRRLLEVAVRCPDPFAHVTANDAWMVRRLAPDCIRIELEADDQKLKLAPSKKEKLLTAMGKEVANVHLGTPGAARAILRDLEDRGNKEGDWLISSADAMRTQTKDDYEDWKNT